MSLARPLSADHQAKLKSFLIAEVLKALNAETDKVKDPEHVIREALTNAYTRTKLQLPEGERTHLFNEITTGLIGFGPLQALLDDGDVTEVMVNGPSAVYAERNGRILKTDIVFINNEQIIRVIENIVRPLGRTISPDYPAVDARLPDGSRVNAIIPPVAIDGPSITIRKFPKERLGIPDLIRLGSLSEKMAEFLEACVKARLNIIISGGTGSGKTTLLNILSSFIPPEERIVTIEDAAELQLHQEHVVRLETRPPNIEGKGAIRQRQLVINCLRMRPDRIVVGEVRGEEALDMLQAMNTGHDGSLTTIHANAPRDALSRLETMVAMANLNIPDTAIRRQIASAIDVVIQVSRLSDGTRKLTTVAEIVGMEGEVVTMQDIFEFKKMGIGENGEVLGEFRPTGIRPKFCEQLIASGIRLPMDMFEVPLNY